MILQGGLSLRSFRAGAQVTPTFFITLFERPKRVDERMTLAEADRWQSIK